MLKSLKSSVFNDQVAIFLFGLGVIVCMQMSWMPGFFHDGYLYAAFGKNASELGKWLVPHLAPDAYSRFEQHLPTIFILEGLFFKVFGTSYTSARLFNSLFFMGTMVGVFSWVRQVSEEKRDAYYSLFFFIVLPPLLKKVRFPNLDIPLMFTIFWSFYYYTLALRSDRKTHWLMTGFFFGFAMLIKGPVGLLVPSSIVVNLILKKKLGKLINLKAWSGLFFGFLIFSIWPISLYATGNFDIFLDWFKFTFLVTIKDARSAPEPFYTYFIFLLKQAHIWVILSALGLYKFWRTRFFIDAFSFFTGILVVLSIPKFKYSHYIIPLYPFLAICSAVGLRAIGGAFYRNFYRGFVGLAFCTSIILVVFPLTNKSRRDPEVHLLKSLLKHIDSPIKAWINVNGIYSGVALTSLNVFEGGTPVLMLQLEDILNRPHAFIKDKLIFVSDTEVEKLMQSNKELRVLALITRYSITILAQKNLLEVSKPLKL